VRPLAKPFPSRLFGCAVVLVATALVAPAAPAEEPPVSVDFDVVTADLEGQLFTSVLPFDVPFILTGGVPAGAQELQVRCWELTSATPLTAAERLASPDGKGCWGATPLEWSNTIDPAAPGPSFRVLVPRLEAEKYYQFDFSTKKAITEAEAAEFAAQVAGIVDPFLWGDSARTADLPLRGDLAQGDTLAMRRQLIEGLKTVTGADRFPTTGSIFNEATSDDAAHAELVRVLRPVRDAQGKIAKVATDYNDDIVLLNPNLRLLKAEPSLGKLRDALATRAAGDPAFQDLANRVAIALDLPPAPVLGQGDRASAARLRAFVNQAKEYFATHQPKIEELRTLLAGAPTGSERSLEAKLAPLVASSSLTPADLAAVRSLADDRKLVGTVARAFDPGGGAVQRFEQTLTQRDVALAAVVAAYQTEARNQVAIAGSTTGSFATQSQNYISADTGLLCAPELDDCSTYLGTNIYFRPVNKAAPLNQFGPFFSRESLGRRVSLTLGLTADGIGDGGKTRDDLFSNQSLVVGLGVRLSGSVRFTVGALVFKKLDPNPLIDDETLAGTWFLSMSFDIDVAGGAQGIFKLLNPGG
jgi:hypothetical protein